MSGILVSGILVLCAAAAACAGLIVMLRPVLERYALARPNARSSHEKPTAQGGGIAVIGTTLASLADRLRRGACPSAEPPCRNSPR